ncbi:MAG: GNAT family N-acetyltransferase [Betaproteobacteria bacterium]|nr:GNAT family N-acetyltransferase [Betaproteobacteria bacterium]
MPLVAPPPLETPRFVVRPLVADDLAGLMAVNGDEAVTRHLPYATWKSMDDARAWLSRMEGIQATGTAIQFVIADRADGKPVGTCLIFRHDEGSARAELGYVLGRAHWGQGAMQEALSALLDCAFTQLGIRRIEAEVDPRNGASCRVLGRLGFTREGLLRQRWVADGVAYDVESWGLLADDWRANRARPDPHVVDTESKLAALFGEVNANSVRKEVDHIPPVYRAMIEASPFVILATSNAKGIDISPRGDPSGFVVVEDERTLLIPERRGNNRVDTLRNLLADSRLGLLFLIPGVGETLRVAGRARFTTDPGLRERFRMEGRPPKGVLHVKVEKAYFQCARALQRSRLWEAVIERNPAVPTAGAILAALADPGFDPEQYDRDLPERQRGSLY